MKAKEKSKTHVIESNIENNGVKTEPRKTNMKDDPNLKLITAPLKGIIHFNLRGELTEPSKVGDTVYAGERICYLQTNYSNNEIICPYNGEIVEIVVHQGANVNKGEVLFTIREKEEI